MIGFDYSWNCNDYMLSQVSHTNQAEHIYLRFDSNVHKFKHEHKLKLDDNNNDKLKSSKSYCTRLYLSALWTSDSILFDINFFY